ncbi:MAG: UvrB/UvrC motif-containing protein [Oscillospiraceae bacterium]|jgi:protein arginine kinase activator|nr:UvrB/UvrC motif-containing protein [Oscillospiraceae bacterium]
MLCQHCKQNEATTHIRRVVNGAAEEFHLCALCAKEAGLPPQPEFGFHLSDLFSGFLGSSLRGQGPPSPVRCGLCGSSLSEIIQSSRVGCAQCYETFGEQLRPTLQRIHGALLHTGKAPGADPAAADRKRRQARAEQLRGEIGEAVRAEDYERAAQLRDEIRELEEGGADHA